VASKKAQIVELTKRLDHALKALEDVQGAWKREVAGHEATFTDLKRTRLGLADAKAALADVKAAWDHDLERREAAEAELGDLRRQLSKVREAHDREHEALYPETLKGRGVLGGPLIDTSTFPQWQKMTKNADRC